MKLKPAFQDEIARVQRNERFLQQVYEARLHAGDANRAVDTAKVALADAVIAAGGTFTRADVERLTKELDEAIDRNCKALVQKAIDESKARVNRQLDNARHLAAIETLRAAADEARQCASMGDADDVLRDALRKTADYAKKAEALLEFPSHEVIEATSRPRLDEVLAAAARQRAKADTVGGAPVAVDQPVKPGPMMAEMLAADPLPPIARGKWPSCMHCGAAVTCGHFDGCPNKRGG